jgi:hypothetical protein
MWRALIFVFTVLVFIPWPGEVHAADAAPADGPGHAEAVGHDCTAEASVRVRADAAADAQAACEGARRALGFLRKAGMELPRETFIDIVEHLPADLDGKAVGCYIPATRRVVLLTYRAFAATGTWFRVPVDLELYRAAASHEVAHATVACNAPSGRLPLAAHEYVAYVTMFATAEAGTRQRILGRFPGRGLANSLQINLFGYLVDPLQFAADAWRHYLRQPDRAAWLRGIVAGRVVEEWPSEGP